VLGAVDNTCVRHTSGLEAKKIGVVSEHNPLLGKPVSSLLFVVGFDEPGFLRGGHVDVAAAKAIGDRRIATLIQVEANRPSHWASWTQGVSGASTAGTSPSDPRRNASLPRCRRRFPACDRSNRREPHAPGRE